MITIFRMPLLTGTAALAATTAFVGALPAHASLIVPGRDTAVLEVVATDQDLSIDTGMMTNTDEYGFGLVAQLLGETFCGTLTVNVTGDILTGAAGVETHGCGQSTVNVLAGTSMTRTSWGFPTLRNTGRNITTNIEGIVAAQTASDFVVDNWVGDFPADNPTGAATLNLGSSAQLTGWIYMSVGSDVMTIDPGGQWTTAGVNQFAEGSDSLINRGTIFAYAGAAFNDLENFVNSGTIDLGDGATAILNISGDYFGESGHLRMEVSGPMADQLVIGGAAGGATSVHVNFLTDGVFSSSGFLLIDAGTSSSDAFSLGSITGNVSDLVDYKLTQSGSDYFLEATPKAVAFQPMALSMAAEELSHRSADNIARSLGRSPRARRKTPFALWGTSHSGPWSRAQLGTSPSGAVDAAETLGSQFGADLMLRRNLFVGVTGRYGQINAHPRLLSAGIRGEGSNFGVYGQLASDTGLYATALLKKDTQDLQLTDSVFRKANGGGSGVGLHLEGGRRWQRGSTGFDLSTGLAFVRTKINGFDVEGISYQFEDRSSFRGRMATGIRFAGPLAPFINAEIHHDFAGESRMKLVSGPEAILAETADRKTWARFEMGLGSQTGAAPGLTAWGQVGKDEAVGLRASLRL